MNYINLDNGLIRHNIRTAPRISMVDFERIIEDMFSTTEEDELSEVILYLMNEGDCRVKQLSADLNELKGEKSELAVEGMKMSLNRIPYLEITFGSYHSVPVLAAIYFDGNTLRAYIPRYGNTYNIQESQIIDPYASAYDVKYPFSITTSNIVEGDKKLIINNDNEYSTFAMDTLEFVDINREACKLDIASAIKGL